MVGFNPQNNNLLPGFEEFDCPICLERMKPPKKIFQCKNGHVLCETCIEKVYRCPTCRIPFSGEQRIRNIALEKLVEDIFKHHK